jgi:hypothetical protein
MNITRKTIKETLKNIMAEESEYQIFFKKALEKAGKSIPSMSDEEKKEFFNKIDAAWNAKGEKNEALKGDQHKLDVDGDGDIEADDLAALRAGKKANESSDCGCGCGGVTEGGCGDTKVTEGVSPKDMESLTEGRAFINAAKKAKAEGKTEFEFNGKTYPVTIKESVNEASRRATDFYGDSKHGKAIDLLLKGKWDSKKVENFLEKLGGGNDVKYARIIDFVSGDAGLNIRKYKNIGEQLPELMKQLEVLYKDFLSESVNEGKKRFNTNYGVGKSKYVVNYHDGVKKHKDGSDFFDVQIFKNQKDLEAFKKALLQKGFVAESVNEDRNMNVKVKQLLDKGLSDLSKGKPNHQFAVMHVLMGALTDANFHSEAKKVPSIFTRAKYEGDPRGEKDVIGIYEEMGENVASICKWDGKDIVDAIGFYVSMTIGRPVGEKVEKLVESINETIYLLNNKK